MADINWQDMNSQLSENFKVGEALYLPSWKIYHIPSDTEKQNILNMVEKMELIRNFLDDRPITINCWIRPKSVNCPGSQFNGLSYNALVKGAPNSWHCVGSAVDWVIPSQTCDEIRHLLEEKLEEFQIRMEKKPGSNWVHTDIGILLPGHSRYFIP